MARKDALLKLHARLVARKRELIGKIEEQLVQLRTEQDHTAGDELDAAAISMNSELTTSASEVEPTLIVTTHLLKNDKKPPAPKKPKEKKKTAIEEASEGEHGLAPIRY